MVGVRLEHLSDGEHVPGDCGAIGAAARVDAAGGERDVEQLGADPLVDVAVEIDGDEVEVVRGADGAVGGAEFECHGHEMVLLVVAARVGRTVVTIVNEPPGGRS